MHTSVVKRTVPLRHRKYGVEYKSMVHVWQRYTDVHVMCSLYRIYPQHGNSTAHANCGFWVLLMSTAVGQAVACVPVSQRARVRSPVGTSFLVRFFRGFYSPVRQMSGSFRPPRSPNIIWPSLSSSIIIHYGPQWPEMLTRPKTSNIHTYTTYTQYCWLLSTTHLRWFGVIVKDQIKVLRVR